MPRAYLALSLMQTRGLAVPFCLFLSSSLFLVLLLPSCFLFLYLGPVLCLRLNRFVHTKWVLYHWAKAHKTGTVPLTWRSFQSLSLFYTPQSYKSEETESIPRPDEGVRPITVPLCTWLHDVFYFQWFLWFFSLCCFSWPYPEAVKEGAIFPPSLQEDTEIDYWEVWGLLKELLMPWTDRGATAWQGL